MGVKVRQETPDSTSIKMYKLEPSSKNKVNNRFLNDYAEKNKSEIWKQINRFGYSNL